MKEAATLSSRETEVAKLIAWGAAKKEIAVMLSISERTVENHTRMIFRKVGVQKSNELSAWWFCSTYHIPFTESPLLSTSKFPQQS
jgi:DNA-binding CsgD family transcriptional regulator